MKKILKIFLLFLRIIIVKDIMKKKNKIVISGGNGELAKEILKNNTDFKIYAPNKSELNILQKNSLKKYIENVSPEFFIHAAAFTRPMRKHNESPDKSIQTNIIGTSNVVMECMKKNIKLIYISTDYVYPGITGNYKEIDPLLPFEGKKDGINKYGWSKLGGECAVQIYDNSLIVRLCMSKKPFPHAQAPNDVFKSYIYSDEAAKIILKILHMKGVINVGGKTQSIFSFAYEENPNIKEINRNTIQDVLIAPNTSMNISKLKNFLKKLR
jgi:dTDP-4-dehydrorhamnose reductase